MAGSHHEGRKAPHLADSWEGRSQGNPWRDGCVTGGNLANQTDFLDLYRTLGLDPDCGLIEFKQAYRRHVALLHPDRPTGTPGDSGEDRPGPLQEVIAQYGAAMEFHRRYGRLPGAAMRTPRFDATDAVSVHSMRRSRVLPAASPHALPRSKWLILLAMVATGVLLWNVAPRAMLTETTPAQMSDDSDPPDSVAEPMLSLGMSADGVRAIEGDPLSIQGDRWEYGPSWIGFDHEVVIDWYSSPRHPLHVLARRPPDAQR